MNTDLEIIPEWNRELLAGIKGALVAQWINSELISQKIFQLMSAKTMTNSWKEFDDNKVILETIKLVLKMSWVKWLGDGPQIAIFNNMPWKNDRLQY